jgi:hypothetical protein
MGTSKPTDEPHSLTGSPRLETRDQLILRRRSAQRAWRTAREIADRAALHLRETPGGHLVPAAARNIERAQLAERAARASYYRVAEETGKLLGRLARVPG